MFPHVPAFAHFVRDTPGRGRCSHPGGHPPLKGRTAGGGWRTAAKKVYPSHLCAVMAAALRRGLEDGAAARDEAGSSHDPLPERARELHASAPTGADDAEERLAQQPDFHGGRGGKGARAAARAAARRRVDSLTAWARDWSAPTPPPPPPPRAAC